MDVSAAREKMARLIKSERQTLMKAAEALGTKMLPLIRQRLDATRQVRNERKAATRLQAVRRGQLLRRQAAGLLHLHRTRNRAARMRSKRLMVQMLKSQHTAPICTSACFQPPSSEELAISKARRKIWAMGPNNLVASELSSQAAVVRSHVNSLNKFLQASPEGQPKPKHSKGFNVSTTSMGGGGGANKANTGALSTPWSALKLLMTDGVELTCMVDKRCNNTTVGSLQLPSNLTIIKMRINSRFVAAPKNSTSLHTQKLLDGDQIVLRGYTHDIAGVCDVKGGKLMICPYKERKSSTKLLRERESCLSSAKSLASKLQVLSRKRLALRDKHRRDHAALVIQIEWSLSRAAQLSKQVTERRREFTNNVLIDGARRTARQSARGAAVAEAAKAKEPIMYPPEAVVSATAPMLVQPSSAVATGSAVEAMWRQSAAAPGWLSGGEHGSAPTSTNTTRRSTARPTGGGLYPAYYEAPQEEEEELVVDEEEEAAVAADLLAEVFGKSRTVVNKEALHKAMARGAEEDSIEIW